MPLRGLGPCAVLRHTHNWGWVATSSMCKCFALLWPTKHRAAVAQRGQQTRAAGSRSTRFWNSGHVRALVIMNVCHTPETLERSSFRLLVHYAVVARGGGLHVSARISVSTTPSLDSMCNVSPARTLTFSAAVQNLIDPRVSRRRGLCTSTHVGPDCCFACYASAEGFFVHMFMTWCMTSARVLRAGIWQGVAGITAARRRTAGAQWRR